MHTPDLTRGRRLIATFDAAADHAAWWSALTPQERSDVVEAALRDSTPEGRMAALGERLAVAV